MHNPKIKLATTLPAENFYNLKKIYYFLDFYQKYSIIYCETDFERLDAGL